MVRKNAIRWGLAVVLLGFTAIYFLPQLQNLLRGPAINTAVHISCADLSQVCRFQIDGQAYQVQAAQAIGAAQPFELTLRGRADKVRASWSMQGMEMGPNEYRFIAQNKDVWTATMTLPFCTAARHDWILTLMLDQAQVVINTTAKK